MAKPPVPSHRWRTEAEAALEHPNAIDDKWLLRFAGALEEIDQLRALAETQRAAAEATRATAPKPMPADLLTMFRQVAKASRKIKPLDVPAEMIIALLDEIELERKLLARVRCYAIVDPLGNPAAVCLPNAARMLGIERDIDDLLEGRPASVDAPSEPPRCGGRGDACIGCYDCNGGRERDERRAQRAAATPLHHRPPFLCPQQTMTGCRGTPAQPDSCRWCGGPITIE